MRSRYVIENTNFIFKSNLAGEYRKEDRYPSNARTCNIIISDPEMVQEMIDDGFNVRETKPNDGYEEDFVPEYFVKATLKFQSEGARSNPVVCVVDPDGYSIPLNEDTVGNLDTMRIRRNSVRAILSPYTRGGDHPTLYIQTLYAEQDLDNDPWAGQFPRRPRDY